MDSTETLTNASTRWRLPRRVNEQVIKTLCDRGILTKDQLEEYEHRATWLKKEILHLISKDGLITERELLKMVSDICGIPLIRIADVEVSKEAVESVPARVASRFDVVPLAIDDDTVRLATDRLRPTEDDDHLRVLLGKSMNWALCTSHEIRECIKHYYGVGVDTFSHADDAGSELGGAGADITGFVNEIIKDAVNSGASDIHIEPQDRSWRLRYRIDGVLSTIRLPHGAESEHRAVVSSTKVMAQVDIAEHRLPQDGRFSVTIDERELDLRVSVLPAQHGEAIVMRILNRESSLINLDHIGWTEDQLQVMRRFLAISNGIVLFTGPTGSGKTTSLYAALSALNDEHRKIVTIEDPVEYEIKGTTQLQVNAVIGFTFTTGLRSVLRHDPDVILIGEIRDLETARIAMRSAMTGHLVFSTLHTNDSPSALLRLLEMGVEAYLVAASVRGVVAQRLVRQICPRCRREKAVEPWVEAQMRTLCPENTDLVTLLYGEGCPDCRFTGYQGRAAIFEILEMTDALREHVVTRPSAATLMESARAAGLVTLLECGWSKVIAGDTTLDEVLRVTHGSP